MKMPSQKTTLPAEPDKETIAGQQAHAGQGDACRCKETSAMSPRELLRLMMNDLAVWTRLKKK